MSKKPQSLRERLKRFALWQWGLLVIFAGLMATPLMMVMQSPAGRPAAEQRAEALGRGVATLVFVVAGVVLIVLHFVRRKPRP